MGEIGQAILQVYRESQPNDTILTKDLYIDEFEGQLDVLHVAIPGDLENFVDIVKPEIDKYLPKVALIHSTVPVGTTRKLGYRAAHTPVNGVHPHLKEGILSFSMFIGANAQGTLREALFALNRLNIYTKIMDSSEETELAKLADTTYYGLCIAYHAFIGRICKERGLDFENVMTAWNHNYNETYPKLGKPNVVRPVLYPPEDGKIGGHCVITNATLLEKQFGEDPILTSILRHA